MRLCLHSLLCLGLVTLAAGCRTGGNGPQFGSAPPPSLSAKIEPGAFSSIEQTNKIRAEWLKPPTDFFRLGPGDTLEIEILGEANSRASVFLGPDGKVYYNLLPGLFVWGLTLSETKDLIEKELGKQMRVKPEVAITLRSVASKRVWLLGSVQKPGVYPLATPVSVLEAISQAGGTLHPLGGLEAVPDLGRSFLLRDGQMVNVDFHRLLAQGDMTQNIYLQAGDFLYLRSSLSQNVYVMGAVAAPSVVPYTDRLSLLSAIASCGGTVPYANVAHVALVRGSLSDPKFVSLDFAAIRKGKSPDVLLQEGDIVYVSYVPYRKVAMFFENVLRQFVSTVAANEGYRAAGGTGAVTPTSGVLPQVPTR